MALIMCIFFTVLSLSVGVECQICTKRSVFTKFETEWSPFTYTETYLGNCWYKCIKTRVRVENQPREVSRRVVKNEKVCCEGYTRFDLGIDDNRLDCRPICMPPCVGGYCKNPGECTCNEGYVKNSTQECLPVCSNGCKHGICVAPDTCRCNFGYNLSNGACQPVCTEPCVNGTCFAPETCQCYPGYRKSVSNICEPYCYNGCEHGRCVAPETCSCDPGWYVNEANNCVAICDYPCGNGTCTAPNVCDCFPGYMSFGNISIALMKGPICTPVCNNCEGLCVAPHECVCTSPYETKHMGADGRNCDCFDNCTDVTKKCERTVCVITSSSTATTEFQTIMDDEATENNEVLNTVYSITDKMYKTTILSTDVTETMISAIFDSNDSTLINSYSSNKMKNSSTWLQSNWIYIVLCAISLVAVLMIVILVVRWKYVIIFFKGGSYIVEGYAC